MKIPYKVIRSNRKTTSLEISRSGEVIARCPLGMPEERIAALVEDHRLWIEKHLALVPKKEVQPKLTTEELQTLGQQAVVYFPKRVAFFADRGLAFCLFRCSAFISLWNLGFQTQPVQMLSRKSLTGSRVRIGKSDPVLPVFMIRIVHGRPVAIGR